METNMKVTYIKRLEDGRPVINQCNIEAGDH